MPDNDQIRTYLTHMIHAGRIGNSLLFAGPQGSGKLQMAHELAQMVICQNDPAGLHLAKLEKGIHPDLHVYRPEGKIGMHSIDSLRQLSAEVYLPSNEADWKVFIVHEAERMLPYSSNALLKTFEEPAPRSLIILLSSYPERLLPTIISRCRRIYFKPQPGVQSSPMPPALEKLLAKGRFYTLQEMKAAVADLSQAIEERKKEFELQAKEQQTKGEYLTSVQKEHMQKEMDGIVTLKYHQEVDQLFHAIFSWFRDMHLLMVNGDKNLLINNLLLNELEQAVQRGEIQPLDQVEKALKQAKLSIERFTPLDHCLETLFFKLKIA